MLRLLPPAHLALEAKILAEKNADLSGLAFATSGTSGAPKWVLHSVENLDWCARATNRHFGCSAEDVWGLALPECHVGGYCLTHRAQIAGGRLATFRPKWDPTLFGPWLRQEKVTITSLVPTQVFDLLRAEVSAPPALRVALIGGEHLEEALFEKALSLGWPLVTSYGMTETAGLIAASAVGERTLRPLPGWQLARDSDGLLTIDGPGLFQGYLSAAGLQRPDHPFTTKDLVDLEEDALFIRGRSDDQIKVLGELVDLSQMRRKLAATLPGYRSTLIALPDERRGHLLIPAIEGRPSDALRQALDQWGAELPGFARCQPPHFSPQWPLTPLGKIDRRALEEEIANERNSLLPPP